MMLLPEGGKGKKEMRGLEYLRGEKKKKKESYSTQASLVRCFCSPCKEMIFLL
jgi:hypothetical protein